MFLPWLLVLGTCQQRRSVYSIAVNNSLFHCQCSTSLSLLFLSWYSGALLHVPSVNSLKLQACCLVAPVTVFSHELPLVILCSTCISFMLDSNVDGAGGQKGGSHPHPPHPHTASPTTTSLQGKQKTVKGREKGNERNAYPGEWQRPTISAGSILLSETAFASIEGPNHLQMERSSVSLSSVC